MHIFLTGPIQIGKSTIIHKAISDMASEKLGGFRSITMKTKLPGAIGEVYLLPPAGYATYTRDNLIGVRWGQGRFSAFPQVFEDYGLQLLSANASHRLIIMDELGVMEQNAPIFRSRILEILNGPVPVLGVVKPKPGLLLDAVRAHPQVHVFEVSENNRDTLPKQIRDLLLEMQ